MSGDPERARERARAWYAANPDRGKANARASRERDPERVKERDRARYAANREARLAEAALPVNRAKKAARMKAARAADPEGSRLKFRAWAYSVSVEALTAMLAAGCGVCGATAGLHVDHDHRCCPPGRGGPKSCGRCVRGVLCNGCNTAAGLTGESPARLRALAAYLERHA